MLFRAGLASPLKALLFFKGLIRPLKGFKRPFEAIKRL
jgi:hypothetical protein